MKPVPETPSRALYDEAGRSNLSRALMRLFGHWRLSGTQQLALLGLNTGSRATLARYRQGKPLARQRDLLDRAGHLLAIHKNLRLIYPRNRELAYTWMTARNQDFGGHAPVEVVAEHGLAGMLMVRAYLDHARGD